MNNQLCFGSRKKRIGLIVPFSNTNAEADFQLLCPDQVSTHSVRQGGYDVDAIPDSGEMQNFSNQSILSSVELLRPVKPQVVAYCCTSATLAQGVDFDHQFCQELSQQMGCPAITAASAVVEVLKELAIERVSFTSAYVKKLSNDSVHFLEECQIEVLKEVFFEQQLNSLEQNALTPQDAFDRALRCDHPEAQAIVISCTDYRAVEAIESIEQAVGKPVISSNSALIYLSLKKMGINTQNIRAGGYLFHRKQEFWHGY